MFFDIIHAQYNSDSKIDLEFENGKNSCRQSMELSCGKRARLILPGGPL